MFTPDNLQKGKDFEPFSFGKINSALFFSIPDNYFQHFPQNVLDMIQVMDQDEIYLNASPKNPYFVDSTYFEHFGSQVLLKIKSEKEHRTQFLQSLSKRNPFVLPEAYFQNFEREVFTQLKHTSTPDISNATEEIEQLSPLLASLKNKVSYVAPDGYFEKPVGKTIPFKAPDSEKRIQWMRWMAAAMILFIFSLGGFGILNSTSSSKTMTGMASIHQQLATIPDSDIQEYLKGALNDYELNMIAQNIVEPTSSEELFEGVSNAEIKTFLENGAY